VGDYERGFSAGYLVGWREGTGSPVTDQTHTIDMKVRSPPSKRKRRQSPKQRLLTKMAGTAWTRYKRGNGKKTYLDIRAQVSRSADYKRLSKKL